MAGSHDPSTSDSSQTGHKRRRILQGTGAVVLGSSVAGCLGGDESPADDDDDDGDDGGTEYDEESREYGEPQQGGELIYSSGDNTQELHPFYMAAAASSQFVSQIVESLFILNDDLEAEPVLVADYTTEEDRVFTFELEEGVMFHPPADREMVADDVVASFEHIAEDDTTQHYTDFQAIERLEAIDDYTVEMELDQSRPLFIEATLTSDRTPVLPEEYLEDEQPLGTGPFQFVEREQGNFARMEAFDDYWRDEYPYFDAVEAQPRTEGSVRRQELEQGGVHIVEEFPSQHADSLADNEEAHLVPVEYRASEFLTFNVEREPFDDARVRKAVDYALNREELIEFALDGWGQPGVTPLPPDSPYAVDEEPLEQDLDEAQRLLEEAGYGDGFETTFILPEAYPRTVEAGTPIQQYLEQIGIDAELERVTWDTWMSNTFADVDYEMTLVPFFGVVDPVNGLNWIYETGGFFNYFNYSDDEMDEMLNEARTTVDDDARMELYEEIQYKALEEAPLIVPYYRDQLYARRNEVEGQLVWGDGSMRFWRNWFGEEE